ncbi:hypothetical protein EI94DRAFT_567992 [Lactarius quietus]|nr:hypothetical protein EI94DRAFT_567992 [Lactarius quietus]
MRYIVFGFRGRDLHVNHQEESNSAVSTKGEIVALTVPRFGLIPVLGFNFFKVMAKGKIPDLIVQNASKPPRGEDERSECLTLFVLECSACKRRDSTFKIFGVCVPYLIFLQKATFFVAESFVTCYWKLGILEARHASVPLQLCHLVEALPLRPHVSSCF